MSRKTVILIAVLLSIALAAMPVFAGGKSEAGGTAAPAAKALLPWTGDPVVWKGFGADLGIKEDPNAVVVQEYRKTTGSASIKWDTAPWNDYDTKMNLYLASGDMPDIMWARDSVPKANMYGPKGLFLNWDDYKDYMPNLQKWVAKYAQVNNVLTADGKRYAVNDITTADYIGEGWFYQGAILAKAGITTPPTTLDELLTDMKKVKAAAPDADGYLSYWGLNYMMQPFGTAMGVPSEQIYYDKNAKKWVYGATMNPNYKKLVQYLHDAYAAHVFNTDALGNAISDDKVQEMIAKGNYAFIYFYYGETLGKWDPAKGQTPPAGMKGMRPPSYAGQSYYWVTVPHDSVPYWGYMANAKVKNPQLLAAYVDNIMSEKSYELFEWGIEGTTFKKAADGSYAYLPEFTSTVGGILGGQKLQALGVGNFMDPRYIHYNDYKKIWFGKYFSRPGDIGREAVAADIKYVQSGKAVPLFSWPRPLMSADQNDEISKIMTPINTYVEEQRTKFVTGDRPMSEWDDFISQVTKMGDLDKVLADYNSGKQFPMGDRLYPDLPADLK